MGKQLITVALIVVGLALLVISYFVPTAHGGSWSEEQEEQYQEVQRQWHSLYARNASAQGGPNAEQKQELEAATAAKKKMDAELDDAQSASGRTSRILFWSGLVVCALGLGSYPFTKPQDR